MKSRREDTPPRVPPKLAPPPPPPPPPASIARPLPATPTAQLSTSYPPSPFREDHVVPISSLPASPRTPTSRRPSTKLNSHFGSTPSPKSSRRVVTPERGRSTSIDFNSSSPSYALDFRNDHHNQHDNNDDDDDDEEEEEEGAPLMLPFNYRQVPPRSLPVPRKPARRPRTCSGRVVWLTSIASTAVVLVYWLGWRIVTKRDVASHTEGGGRFVDDQVLSSISTRLPNTRLGSGNIETEGGSRRLEKESGERDGIGTDGDSITMENGETFVYRNAFGGTFLKFASTSRNLAARAQIDTPTLHEEWDWESMTISGVNLGGWLTLEPFITPALFEPFLTSTTPSPAVDEYTLSQNLLAQGGEGHLAKVLENHYETFITERDFAEIAGAGLNWVRIPLPFWSISKWPGEPFLERTSWKYILKALEWSRKYGLRINLDLHSVPGSQNGWNHSGKWGSINWLHSTMGFANAQRSLDYIETLAEFVSRPEVAEVVQMLSIVNEPMLNVIGTDPLRSFYSKAYRTIRAQTGYGSGPVIAFHDGFKGTRRWFDFPTTGFQDFPSTPTVPSDSSLNSNESKSSRSSSVPVKMIGGMDRVAIDSHRYLSFSEPDTRSVRDQVLKPCQKWATDFNKTFNGFGVPVAGEFSIAINDCGRFLNNVNQGTRLEGTFLNEVSGVPLFNASVAEGTCAFWEDYENWTDVLKESLKDLAYAQMDTFQNWFYWTWKTSPSLQRPDRFANPLWSYSLGLEQGWIPRNPRLSTDFCYTYASENHLMTGMPRRRARKDRETMEGWKVGRYSAEEQRIVPTGDKIDSGRYPWPPKSFLIDAMSAPSSYNVSSPKLTVEDLPRYSRTSPPVRLPGPGSASLSTSASSRLRPWHAPIEGCAYPETWNSGNTTDWNKTCLARP